LFHTWKQTYSNRTVYFYSNNLPNNSPGICRNIGINHAHGRYLLFADSDDYFIDNWWDTTSKFLDSNYDLIFFPPTSINESTKQLGKRHITGQTIIQNYLSKKDRLSELALRYSYSSPCSKLVSSELLIRGNILFDEILTSEDTMFSYYCGYYAKSIHCETIPIYCITETDTSLTSTRSPKTEAIRNKTKLRRFLALKPLVSADELSALGYENYINNLFFDSISNKIPWADINELVQMVRREKIRLLFSGNLSITTLMKALIKRIL